MMGARPPDRVERLGTHAGQLGCQGPCAWVWAPREQWPFPLPTPSLLGQPVCVTAAQGPVRKPPRQAREEECLPLLSEPGFRCGQRPSSGLPPAPTDEELGRRPGEGWHLLGSSSAATQGMM